MYNGPCDMRNARTICFGYAVTFEPVSKLSSRGFSKLNLHLSPGIVHFAQAIRSLEKEDPEVAHLHAQVRAHFLPPVAINTEPSS